MIDFGRDLKKAVSYFVKPTTYSAVVVFRGDATGDLPHVLPVVGLGQTIGVLVVDGIKQITKEVKDATLEKVKTRMKAIRDEKVAKSEQLDNTELKATEREEKKKALDTIATNGKKNVAEVMEYQYGLPSASIGYLRDPEQMVTALVAEATKQLRANEVRVIELSEATRILRQDYLGTPQTRELVRNFLTCRSNVSALSSLSAMDPIYQGILDRAGAKEEVLKKNVVVIWGRTAAKPEFGGAHYDLNHSNTGWADVANLCLDKGLMVMMTGDLDPKKWAVQTGFGGTPVANYVFLGKFFQDTANNINLTRPQQLRFWEYLRDVLSRSGKGLVHVGMRSGGMDFLGFAGQPIIYVIARGAEDRRMKPVAEQLAMAADMNYSRFEASRRPKLWNEPGTYNVVPDAARKADPDTERGFTDEDLDRLMKEILRKLPG